MVRDTMCWDKILSRCAADNLAKLAASTVDVAFVQLDILETGARERANYQSLRAIASVNFNLLHALVRKSGFEVRGADREVSSWGGFKKTMVPGDVTRITFSNVSDLKGYTVAAVGTAVDVVHFVNKNNNLGLEIIDRDRNGVSLNDATAMTMVQKGEVAAMFTISGWPHGMLREASADNKDLITVNFNLAPAPKQQIVTVDYDSLGVRGTKLLGIPNLIVAQGYEEGTPGYNNVKKFADCLMSKWKVLRNTRGNHPGWKEASDPTNTYGWPKFAGGGVTAAAEKK